MVKETYGVYVLETDKGVKLEPGQNIYILKKLKNFSKKILEKSKLIT